MSEFENSLNLALDLNKTKRRDKRSEIPPSFSTAAINASHILPPHAPGPQGLLLPRGCGSARLLQMQDSALLIRRESLTEVQTGEVRALPLSLHAL